jgi:hypothetical protein
VDLVQLFRFVVVKLIYSGLNLRFDVDTIFMANYSFSGMRRPIDSETLLVTDFMNLKIKLAQSFKDTYRSRIYVRVFIEVSAHMCMSICVYTVLLKRNVLAKA